MGLELQQYGFYIEKTAKRIKQHLQRKFNAMDCGITVDQWVVLDVLRETDGISQLEIADRTYKDAPTITRIIDLLSRKKLINRVMDSKDRRKFNIQLTQEGKEKIKEVWPIVKSMRAEGWNGLGREDYDHLLRILGVVFNNFSNHHDS